MMSPPRTGRRLVAMKTMAWLPGGRVRVRTDRETSLRLGRIRQAGTSPELVVRQVLSGLGIRFTTANRDLAGSPDLANRARGWVVFVHGCFWHHHGKCRRATIPKRNRNFWLKKFISNRSRDRAAIQKLKAGGYQVVTFWECQVLSKPDVVRTKVQSLFSIGNRAPRSKNMAGLRPRNKPLQAHRSPARAVSRPGRRVSD
jgi:DNA mismatch endonuclease, patch repair protein